MNDEDFERILENYTPMIKRIAWQWKKEPRVPLEDLVSVGQMAAVTAASKWDPERGASEKTYIYHSARNAIVDFHKKNTFELHASVYFQKDPEEFRKIKEQERRSFSLDKCYSEHELSIKNNIASSGLGPAETAELNEQWSMLDETIKNNLNDREAYIVNNSRRWFGNMTFEEIGEDLGVTKQRISQIEKSIFGKLQEKLVVEEK